MSLLRGPNYICIVVIKMKFEILDKKSLKRRCPFSSLRDVPFHVSLCDPKKYLCPYRISLEIPKYSVGGSQMPTILSIIIRKQDWNFQRGGQGRVDFCHSLWSGFPRQQLVMKLIMRVQTINLLWEGSGEGEGVLLRIFVRGCAARFSQP